MAKFYGKIGFAKQEEIRPGYFKEVSTEKSYCGDIIRENRRYLSGDKVNDDVKIDNQISIVADSYANENFGYMKWIEFGGIKWKISTIQVQRPRLIISMGEVWNGNTNE